MNPLEPTPPPTPPRGPNVPPADGFFWFKAASAYFRAEPLRWLGITAAFLLFVQIVSALPGGILIFGVLKPIIAVGFLAAAWHQERGSQPELAHLVAGAKSNWKALLPLGVFFVVGLIIAVSLASNIAGISLEQAVANWQSLSKQELAKLNTAMLWTIVMMLPVIFALWFAPALIVFDDASFGAAISQSLAACVQNFGAILAYMLSLFGMALLLSLVVVAARAVSPSFEKIALFAASLPLSAIMLIADYIAYRRVFHPEQPLRVPDVRR